MKKQLILTVLIALGYSAQAQAETTAVMESIKYKVEHRDSAVRGAIWYPTNNPRRMTDFGDNGVFHGTMVARKGEITDGKHPVVLVSHGLGGNIRSLSWLTAGLAARGAFVVSVNHPDSTTRDVDLPRALDHGTRVADFSAILDWLAVEYRDEVDLSRVMAAGFSLGGWTALSMAGVTGDLDGYASHCREAGDRSTHCVDIARGGMDWDALDADRWNASYGDPRVTHVAAIDPAFLYGVKAEDVASVTADVMLIGLGAGKQRLFATDFSEAGNGFSALLPEAEVVTIAPAYHFSTLLTCKPNGPEILEAEGDDPVCTDPVDADRAQIHADIVEAMAQHFGL